MIYPHRLRAGPDLRASQPLIAAADGIRTVAVELALILAYASVVETFNLVGVNGTLSAQMEIAGINGAVIALVLGLLVLAGGLLGTLRLCGGGAGHLSGQQLQLWKL